MNQRSDHHSQGVDATIPWQVRDITISEKKLWDKEGAQVTAKPHGSTDMNTNGETFVELVKSMFSNR
jgi:hypothetical protein